MGEQPPKANESHESCVTLPYLWVDYDEFKPETYRAVVIDLPDGKRIRFASGDFDVDFHKAENHIFLVLGCGYLHASSLDNFEADRKRAQQVN